MLARLPSLTIMLVALVAVGSVSSCTNATEPTKPTQPAADEPAPPQCVPAVDDTSRTVRIFGTGSHALARTDVSVALATGVFSGDHYELDGSAVTPITVEGTLEPDELSRLRQALEGACIEVKKPDAPPQAVAGGSSYVEVTGDGGTVRIMFGTPHDSMPDDVGYASVSREVWTGITDAYPKFRPSERADSQ